MLQRKCKRVVRGDSWWKQWTETKKTKALLRHPSVIISFRATKITSSPWSHCHTRSLWVLVLSKEMNTIWSGIAIKDQIQLVQGVRSSQWLWCLQTTGVLDREKTDYYVVVVKATEECGATVSANSSRFDPRDDTTLRLLIHVNDVNDNPPQFVKRVFTGGVTTDADFGTEFMQIKVTRQ